MRSGVCKFCTDHIFIQFSLCKLLFHYCLAFCCMLFIFNVVLLVIFFLVHWGTNELVFCGLFGAGIYAYSTRKIKQRAKVRIF